MRENHGGMTPEKPVTAGEKLFSGISRTGVLVLLALLLCLAEGLFALWLTPGYARATGGGEILDMASAYPPEKTAAFLEALRNGGLVWYNRVQAVDGLFPFVYGLFFAGLLYRLYRNKYGDHHRAFRMTLLPLTAAGADLLENLTIRILILSGTAEPGFWGRIPGIFSLVKFLGLGLSVLFLLTGIGYFVKGRRDAAFAPGERRKISPETGHAGSAGTTGIPEGPSPGSSGASGGDSGSDGADPGSTDSSAG